MAFITPASAVEISAAARIVRAFTICTTASASAYIADISASNKTSWTWFNPENAQLIKGVKMDGCEQNWPPYIKLNGPKT